MSNTKHLTDYISTKNLITVIQSSFEKTPYVTEITEDELKKLAFKREYGEEDLQSPFIAEFSPKDKGDFVNCSTLAIRFFPEGTHGFYRYAQQIEAAENLVLAAKSIAARNQRNFESDADTDADADINAQIDELFNQYKKKLRVICKKYPEIAPSAFLNKHDKLFDVEGGQPDFCRKFSDEVIRLRGEFEANLILACHQNPSRGPAPKLSPAGWGQEFKSELASVLARNEQKTQVNIFIAPTLGLRPVFVEVQIPSGILSHRQVYRLLMYYLEIDPKLNQTIKEIQHKDDSWFDKAIYLLFKFFKSEFSEQLKEDSPERKLFESICGALQELKILGAFTKKVAEGKVLEPPSNTEEENIEVKLYKRLQSKLEEELKEENEEEAGRITSEKISRIIDEEIRNLENLYYKGCYELTKKIIARKPLLIDGIPLQLLKVRPSKKLMTDDSLESCEIGCYLPTLKRNTPFPLGTTNIKEVTLYGIADESRQPELLVNVERSGSSLAIGVDPAERDSFRRLLTALEAVERDVELLPDKKGRLQNTYFSDLGKLTSELGRIALAGGKTDKRTESEYLQLWETIFATHMCDVARSQEDRKDKPLFLINSGFNHQEKRKHDLSWLISPSSQQAYNLFSLARFVVFHQDVIGIQLDEADYNTLEKILKDLDGVAKKMRKNLLALNKLSSNDPELRKLEAELQRHKLDYQKILKTESDSLLSILGKIKEKLPDKDQLNRSNEKLKKIISYFYFNENLEKSEFKSFIEIPTHISEITQQYGKLKFKGGCKSGTDRTWAWLAEILSSAVGTFISGIGKQIENVKQFAMRVYASICSGSKVAMANTNNTNLQISSYTSWPALANCHKPLSKISVRASKIARQKIDSGIGSRLVRGINSFVKSVSVLKNSSEKNSDEIPRSENLALSPDMAGQAPEVDAEDEDNDLLIQKTNELTDFISLFADRVKKGLPMALAGSTYDWFNWVKEGCSPDEKTHEKTFALTKSLVEIVKGEGGLSRPQLPVLLHSIEINIMKGNVNAMLTGFCQFLLSLAAMKPKGYKKLNINSKEEWQLVIQKIFVMIGYHLAIQAKGEELLQSYITHLFSGEHEEPGENNLNDKSRSGFSETLNRVARLFPGKQKESRENNLNDGFGSVFFETLIARFESEQEEGNEKVFEKNQKILSVLRSNFIKPKLPKYQSETANSWCASVISNGQEIEEAIVSTLLRVKGATTVSLKESDENLRNIKEGIITIFETERSNSLFKRPVTFELVLFLYFERFINATGKTLPEKINDCLDKIADFMPSIFKSAGKPFYLSEEYFSLCEKCFKTFTEYGESPDSKKFLEALGEKLFKYMKLEENIFSYWLNGNYDKVCERLFSKGVFDKDLYRLIHKFIFLGRAILPETSLNRMELPWKNLVNCLCHISSQLSGFGSRQLSFFGNAQNHPIVRLFNSLPVDVVEMMENNLGDNAGLYWNKLAEFYKHRGKPDNSFNQILSILFAYTEGNPIDFGHLEDVCKKLTDFNEIKKLSQVKVEKLIGTLYSSEWRKVMTANSLSSLNLRKLSFELLGHADKNGFLKEEYRAFLQQEKGNIDFLEENLSYIPLTNEPAIFAALN